MTDDSDQLGPPPVEPLSDVAWARVERGLMGRLDTTTTTPIVAASPSRRWLWIAAPLVAAAAVVALVLAMRDSGTQVVVEAPGSADDPEPTRIVSGTAPTSASFGDAHITLDADSAIAMRRDGGQPTTLLERGAARFAVAPRTNRPAFIVRAGDTTVRVVGTRFRVARSVERVVVDVEHGIVEVQFRGSIVQVREQQTWTSDRPSEVATVTKTALAEPKPTPPPPADDELADPIDSGSNVVAAPKRPAKPPTTRTVPEPDPIAPVDPPPPAIDRKPGIDADQAKFAKMQTLERRDPKAAIAGYLELSQRSVRWAEVGLYAAARLAVDSRDPRAESLLTIYVRRFPSGRNAADARKLLGRLKGEP